MTTQQPKSVRDFLSLPHEQKLDFDPSGRPGADDVRKLQSELREQVSLGEYLAWLTETTPHQRAERAVNAVRTVCRTRPQLDRAYVASHYCGFDEPNWRICKHLRAVAERWVALGDASRDKRFYSGGKMMRKFRHEIWARKYVQDTNREPTKESLVAAHKATKAFGFIMHVDRYAKTINQVKVGSWGKINDWYFRVVEASRTEWEKYGRTSYPRTTVDARFVDFVRGDEKKRVLLPAWRGQWFLNAVQQAGITLPVGQPKAIILHPACHAINMHSISRVTLHDICVGDMHWQYCASIGGTHYHDTTVKSALRGLKNKIRAKATGEYVSRALAKSMGFCSAGIERFCDVYGLRGDEILTPSEFEGVVRSRNLSLAEPFASELRKIADHFKLDIPEFR